VSEDSSPPRPDSSPPPEDSPPRRDLGRVVEQVAITALPACVVAGALAAVDVLAPGGVAAWAVLVAAMLTVVASGLALIWSREDVSWRERHAVRAWAIAALVGGSVVAIALGGRPEPDEKYRVALLKVCEEDRDIEVTMREDVALLPTPRSRDRLPYLFGRILQVIQDAQRRESDLLARARKLDPPSEDRSQHHELVDKWDAKLDQEISHVRVARSQLANAANSPKAFQAALQRLVGELNGNIDAESEKDALLQKLADDECIASP
jgi:hypothetical protein